MKTLALFLVFGLFGCSRSELPSTRLLSEVREWVPAGTSLSSAQQIMEQHQFSCIALSFTNRLMMSNSMEAVCWGGDGVRAFGVRDEVVTNVTLLECRRSNAVATLTIVNDLATGRLAVSKVGR